MKRDLNGSPGLLPGGRRGRRGRSMKLRGTPRSRRAICCSSSPSTMGLWRRRVAWVSFIFSRSRHHPQSLQVVSSAAGLELLLMLHQHQLRSPPVTIDEDRRVARRAVVRSRTHPHPQSPPLLLQLRTVDTPRRMLALAQAIRLRHSPTRQNAAVLHAARGNTQDGSGQSAATSLLCSMSSGSGGASDCDVLCRTWRS